MNCSRSVVWSALSYSFITRSAPRVAAEGATAFFQVLRRISLCDVEHNSDKFKIWLNPHELYISLTLSHFRSHTVLICKSHLAVLSRLSVRSLKAGATRADISDVYLISVWANIDCWIKAMYLLNLLIRKQISFEEYWGVYSYIYI